MCSRQSALHSYSRIDVGEELRLIELMAHQLLHQLGLPWGYREYVVGDRGVRRESRIQERGGKRRNVGGRKRPVSRESA